MEILQQYAFKRPSKSRYAPVAKALCDPDPRNRAFAVKLERGVDFPADARVEAVQGSVSQQVRNAVEEVPDLRGRRPRTFIESPDVIVVSLWGESEGPARKRAARRRQAVTA